MNCANCGGPLIGSETDHGTCGHCGGRSLRPKRGTKMRLKLNAGPADGRRLEIRGARLGDVIDLETTSGEVYRYFIEEQQGHDLEALYVGAGADHDPQLPAAVIRISEASLTETWSYDVSTGAFTRRETPGPARAKITELLASSFLWGSIGATFGVSIVLFAEVGFWLHDLLGGWTSFVLWLAGVGAVLGTLHLIAFPDFWREDRG